MFLASPGLGINLWYSWLRQDKAKISNIPGFARIRQRYLIFLASPGLGKNL
jgi:hypothetical protein